jgi:hypothetical protein
MNSLRSFIIALTGLFLAATPKTLGQGPPIGSWDVVISGKYQHGVAQMTFADNGTLSGLVAFTFFGRSVPHTNHGFVLTNVYGGATLDGTWVYDRPNHITGFINELSVTSGSGTNLTTNGLSFRAVVKPSRLSLLAFGSKGTLTYKGIPLVATNDISGTYYGTVFKRSVPFSFVEVFDADNRIPQTVTEYYTTTNEYTVTNCATETTCVTTNQTTCTTVTNNGAAETTCVTTTGTTCTTVTNNCFVVTNSFTTTNSLLVTNYYVQPNYYLVRGRGPGYDYGGFLLLSRQRYAAFYQERPVSANESVISAYAGPFNVRTRRGSLIGTDGTNTATKYRLAPEFP